MLAIALTAFERQILPEASDTVVHSVIWHWLKNSCLAERFRQSRFCVTCFSSENFSTGDLVVRQSASQDANAAAVLNLLKSVPTSVNTERTVFVAKPEAQTDYAEGLIHFSGWSNLLRHANEASCQSLLVAFSRFLRVLSIVGINCTLNFCIAFFDLLLMKR